MVGGLVGGEWERFGGAGWLGVVLEWWCFGIEYRSGVVVEARKSIV